MTLKSKIKANIILIVTLVLILVISLFMIFNNSKYLGAWIIVDLIVLITLSMLSVTIIHDIDILSAERKVKKCLNLTYTKLKISDINNIPLCIKVALEENNITFWGKYFVTRKGITYVHVIAKKDDNFFAEEILTDKGPMFLTCKEFLNTFEV